MQGGFAIGKEFDDLLRLAILILDVFAVGRAQQLVFDQFAVRRVDLNFGEKIIVQDAAKLPVVLQNIKVG